MFSLFCRIFEFRKIIGDRELCKSLVPKDYPVYITKVRSSHCSLWHNPPTCYVLGDFKMCFSSLWADQGRCRLSNPWWILHLSPWTFCPWDLATRGCSCQVPVYRSKEVAKKQTSVYSPGWDWRSRKDVFQCTDMARILRLDWSGLVALSDPALLFLCVHSFSGVVGPWWPGLWSKRQEWLHCFWKILIISSQGSFHIYPCSSSWQRHSLLASLPQNWSYTQFKKYNAMCFQGKCTARTTFQTYQHCKGISKAHVSCN